MTDRRRTLAAWIVGLVLLAGFWGALWRGLDRSVLTRVPVLDEAHYLREGEAIAQGRLLPAQPFVMSPLYPYLVAVTGSGRALDPRGVRLGPPPHGLRLAQAALHLGVIVLLWRTARRLLPRRTAWLPPLLLALYQPAAVFVTTALLEIPLTFAVMAVLALLTGATSRDAAGEPVGADGHRATGGASARRAALIGALIGAATLLRPVAAVLLVPAWLTLRVAPVAAGKADTRRSRAAVRRRLLALVGTVAAVVAPVVVFNSVRAGRLAGVSLNGGMNFYIGQGPGANGFFRTFAGFDFESDPAGVAFLSARTGLPLAGPDAADRFWFAEALAYVRDHPARSVALWLKKIWLHLCAFEIDQVTPLAAWRRDGPLLRALPVPWAAFAAAGLAGLALVARRRAWRPWTLALLLIIAAQSLFFVVSRYRLVLAPILCLLAGAWVDELTRRRGRARALAAAAGLTAALAVWPWGLGETRVGWRALGCANEARRWEALGGPADLGRAEALYRDAVALDATQAQAWQGLARVLVRTGRSAEAERVLGDGILRAEPTHLLLRDLIALLIQEGKAESALPRLAQYLRERPRDPDMLHAQAVALDKTGRREQAIAAARALLAAAPDDPRGYVDLGVLLARAERRDEARELFRRGLQRWPDNAALRHNLQLLEEGGGPGVTRP